MFKRMVTALVVALGLVATGLTAAPAAQAVTPQFGSWWHQYSLDDRTGSAYRAGNIYIRDYTTANWPVTDALTIWNNYFAVNHLGIRFVKISNCTGLPNCVVILEDTTDTTMYPEIATTNYAAVETGTNCGHEGSIYAYFGCFTASPVVLRNYNVNMSADYRLARRRVATHELGHVLGLGHDYNTEDLMYWNADFSAGFSNSTVKGWPSVSNMQALIAGGVSGMYGTKQPGTRFGTMGTKPSGHWLN